MASKVRLYLEHPLREGQSLPLTREQAHYLFGVMRLGFGAMLSVFNGRDGEWDAEVSEVGKRGGALTCVAQTRTLQLPPDLWLLFAPIKKTRTDFIVEKAVELGATRICPILTEFTNSERVRVDRLQTHAVEAAEQCGATWVPEVATPAKLDIVLAQWPEGRGLVFCDEAATGSDALPDAPAAILIGPEGGFSPRERDRLIAHPIAHRISLGPRILRADTAAVAAMSLWQKARGDW